MRRKDNVMNFGLGNWRGAASVVLARDWRAPFFG